MSDRHRALVRSYDTAYNDLVVQLWETEEENKRLRRANAILALPRVTEQQIRETELALRRILALDEALGVRHR